MRKFIIIMIISIIQIGVSVAKPTVQNEKIILTVITLGNGQNMMFVNLPEQVKNINNHAVITANKNSSIEGNDLQSIGLGISPNPIVNNATLSFNLSTNSDVKIYSYDNYFGRKLYFTGNLAKGSHEISLDVSDLNTGLVLMYIEINGKIFTTKAIKI